MISKLPVLTIGTTYLYQNDPVVISSIKSMQEFQYRYCMVGFSYVKSNNCLGSIFASQDEIIRAFKSL